MKKAYVTPLITEEKVKTEFILRPKPNSQGGTGSILVKDRDDETEGGNSPIWGDNGRLW